MLQPSGSHGVGSADPTRLDPPPAAPPDSWATVDRRAVVLSILLQTRRESWAAGDLASHIQVHGGPRWTAKAVQLTLLELAGELELAEWFPYRLQELAEAWTLVLKFPPISMVMTDARPMDLSPWEREVLSCVAYCQPITRNAIHTITDRDPQWAVDKLMEKGLLGTVMEGAYPKLITTSKFLKLFYLRSLEDMPNYEELRKAGLERSQRTRRSPTPSSDPVPVDGSKLGFTSSEEPVTEPEK